MPDKSPTINLINVLETLGIQEPEDTGNETSAISELAQLIQAKIAQTLFLTEAGFDYLPESLNDQTQLQIAEYIKGNKVIVDTKKFPVSQITMPPAHKDLQTFFQNGEITPDLLQSATFQEILGSSIQETANEILNKPELGQLQLLFGHVPRDPEDTLKSPNISVLTKQVEYECKRLLQRNESLQEYIEAFLDAGFLLNLSVDFYEKLQNILSNKGKNLGTSLGDPNGAGGQISSITARVGTGITSAQFHPDLGFMSAVAISILFSTLTLAAHSNDALKEKIPSTIVNLSGNFSLTHLFSVAISSLGTQGLGAYGVMTASAIANFGSYYRLGQMSRSRRLENFSGHRMFPFMSELMTFLDNNKQYHILLDQMHRAVSAHDEPGLHEVFDEVEVHMKIDPAWNEQMTHLTKTTFCAMLEYIRKLEKDPIDEKPQKKRQTKKSTLLR